MNRPHLEGVVVFRIESEDMGITTESRTSSPAFELGGLSIDEGGRRGGDSGRKGKLPIFCF